MPLRTGWFCCSFVIKIKVTCWVGQGSGTGIPNVWNWVSSDCWSLSGHPSPPTPWVFSEILMFSGSVLPLTQIILAVCFQEEVQNSFRGYSSSHRSAGRGAETRHGQAERQGTGQGSSDKLLIFPENFPDLFTNLKFLHSVCELRIWTLPNRPGDAMGFVRNQCDYLIAVWASCCHGERASLST